MSGQTFFYRVYCGIKKALYICSTLNQTHTMKHIIIKRETAYGVAKSLNGQGMSTSTVVDTVEGTLADAGRALLDRLRANELNVDGDTYYSQLSHGTRFAAFTVGQCYCECYEYECEYIIASC